MPTAILYRPPVIKTAKSGSGAEKLYIEYYYRIPQELQKYYENKEWYRFRIKDEINRRSGQDRKDYANWLFAEITTSLKNGYNPFKRALDKIATIAGNLKEDRVVSIREALDIFLKEWEQRGLDAGSMNKYRKYINRLIDWLIINHIQEMPVAEITPEHIEKFLHYNKKEHDLSNREYNNSLMFLRTAFKYLVKKKYIEESPAAEVDKQKSKTRKHRFYDKAALEAVTKALTTKDPYCYFAFQVIYHLCIRSEKELKFFKIGNILWEQNKVFVDIGKADTQRYIPMNEEIKKIFLEHGLDKYPPQYYVFSGGGEPAEKTFGSTFFAKKFSRVRKHAGLDDAYTMYSAKHTRVVHLVQDGATTADLMAMTGHKDPTSLNSYLRGLGVLADAKKINEISRKV